MAFYEASAKTNYNINEIFNFLTIEILKSNEGKTQTQGEKLKKGGDSKDSKSKCYK
jgi:hypothetical protein